MSAPRFRTLLIFALASFAVLAPMSSAGSAGKTGKIDRRGPQGLRGLTGPTGAAGKTGAAGPLGSTGATGLQGSNGSTGGLGLSGAAGLDGSAGAAGLQGTTGATGAPGTAGTNGAAGTTGATGPQGSAGTNGAAGTTGATGPQGPIGPSGRSQYAYVYNVAAEAVAVEADIAFDSNGTLTSGITHVAGATGVTFVTAGIYKITFSVSATGVSQIGLFINGALVPGSNYGSGAGTQQNTGQVILAVAAADVLTVRNHTTGAAVGLPAAVGGTQQTTNASVAIEQLG